jgi:glycosyltransferase involved in cell wall biosynthesis
VISVLLPYRNAAATLREAAVSVLDDLDACDELVTIDDGSSDEGPRVVARLAAEDGRVVPVSAGGVGIARALARGLEIARGDLVARMDADDVSHRGRFAAQRALLAEDRSLGAVGVQIDLRIAGEAAKAEGMGRYVAWQNALVTKEDHARSIYVETPLCHPSTMMRRDALEAVGGFHDPPWAEDWDIWLRMHHAGFGLAKVARVLFTWRRVAGSLTAVGPRYTSARLLEARAAYLSRDLARRERPIAVWGAGPTGRRLARALEAFGLRAALFIDIDPRKIGRIARGAPITPADAGLERVRAEEAVVVVAVGAAGARDLVRAHMMTRGFVEGRDFLCAA